MSHAMHTTPILCSSSRRPEVSKIQHFEIIYTRRNHVQAQLSYPACIDDIIKGSHKRVVSNNTTYEALCLEADDRICAKQDASIAVDEQDEEFLIQSKLLA